MKLLKFWTLRFLALAALPPIAIGAIGTATAQVPYFEHLKLMQKNDAAHVNTIFQDREGYMWFGTDKGLFKYDGTTLKTFSLSDSLPEERVTALAQDSLGRIWTGHRNGTIGYLENGYFQKFNPREGQAVAEISDIIFDKRGNLWYSTLNDGLYYFTQDRLFRLDVDEGMPDIFVYDIAEDKEGIIWAGTDGGLVRCELRDRKTTLTVFDYRTGLSDNIVKKIRLEENGLLLGTEDSGIIHFDPSTGKFLPLIPGWKYGAFTDFLLDEAKVWISSQENGLILYDRKTGQTSIFNALAGAGFTTILSLSKDREGNIWAGTRTDAMRSRGDLLEFIDRFDPLQETNTVALAVDPLGSIWFSTGEGLFTRKADAQGKVIISRPLAGTPYQKHTVISLFADDTGSVWAGLFGEGVLRINIRTHAIQYLNKELQNGNVLHITGKKGTVWLATLGGGTRIQYEGGKLNIKNFTSEDGLASAYIYQVFVDSRNRVWFATDGKGADMMDENGFHHFEAGLKSKVVYGIAEDRNHNLWVNVQGDGLYKLEGDVFRAFDPQGARLRDKNISCFASTASGDLFIMHDLGIDILDVKEDRITSLGEEAGIRNKVPNLNAVTTDEDGNLFAGTEGGIVRYSERLGEYSAGPRPIIEELKVLNKTTGILDAQVLRHSQNDLTINYIGLWYQNPQAVGYQYKLDNYDREWIASQNHSVTYSRLQPGVYTFRVKASDSKDFSNAAEATFSFEVMPPFWQSLWFYAIVGVFVVVLGTLVIQFRERSLREANRILESRVTERTLEIIQKNNEIHNQAEEIRAINENLEELVRQRTRELERKNKALEEYAFINAHELRAPVASIMGLIQLMEAGQAEEEKREYMEHLRASADKLDKVVRSIGKAIEKGE